MKLKIAVLAFALAFSSAGVTQEVKEEPQIAPDFASAVVNKNPIQQLKAADKLVQLYCNIITTRDGRNSPYSNQANCRSQVMFAYMAKLVAETAPYAQFKESAE